MSKPKPSKPAEPPVVTVRNIHPSEQPMCVRGLGTVDFHRMIEVTPELAERLVAEGRFELVSATKSSKGTQEKN